MEALLAELGMQPPATGARAWEEADLANGITVKRVPAHEMTIGQKTIQGLGSGRSSGGSSGSGNGRGGERRVVTAIFAPHTPVHAEPVPLKPLDSAAIIEDLHALAETASVLPTPPPDEQPSPSKSASRPLPEPPVSAGAASAGAEQDTEEAANAADAIRLERMLEEEILATRALVDTFRARLEIVEQKVADLEAREALRAAADLQQAQAQAQAQAEAEAQALLSTPPEPRDQEPAAAGASTSTSTGGARESVEIGVQAQLECESAGAVPVPVPVSARAAVAEAAVQSDDSDGDPRVPLQQQQPPQLHPSSPTARPAPAEPQPQHQFMPGADDHRAGTGDDMQKREEDGDELPSHLSDLPSYVLLAGLGVCAVVTQVVVRRVFGKGLWRP